jgi:hypothetical protein
VLLAVFAAGRGGNSIARAIVGATEWPLLHGRASSWLA